MSKEINKYFFKIITLILILSTFTLPFLGASQVYAQSGSYSSGGAYSSGTSITGGIGSYIELIGPAIQELPLCRDKISNINIKNLFRNTDAIKKSGEALGDATSQLGIDDDPGLFEETIPIRDDKQISQNAEIQKDQAIIKDKLTSLEENDTCLKSIGRMVVKLLLQKITFSTVEWINNGFEGKPLFLENPGDFFKDIATNELLMFRAEISDPSLYPFARSFLRQQVNAINRTFAQNARYSANELIQLTTPEYTAVQFSSDFRFGGWNAWTITTQVPANNPIGFNVIATEELSFRLSGTSSSEAEKKQKDLDQSGGFLGVERCVADPEITKAEHRAALERAEKPKIRVPIYVDNEAAGNNPDTAEIEYIEIDEPNSEIIGICPGNKWEYVTPGKAASEALTKVLNYPDNNILRADDLNAAIATILDAALNKFVPTLLNEGLASISTEGRDGAFIYDDNNRTSGSYTQVSLDFPSSTIRSSWLRENSDFNIRTDLTQAVIDEQRIYQRKLLEQNEVLQDLITTVHQLDYCIPGPNPNYIETGERVLAAVKNSIPAKTAADFDKDAIGKEEVASAAKIISGSAGVIIGASMVASGTALGAALGTAAGPVGTAIGIAIGALTGLIIDLVTDELNSPEKRLNVYYSGIMGGLTGLHLSKPNTNKAGITSKEDITIPLDKMFIRYRQLISRYYTPDFLPTITPAARIEFRKIEGYSKKIENNEFSSTQLESIIVRLAKLKDELDKLNPSVNTYAQYLPFINEFARLSGSMVTGNDIAKLYDETKDYTDQIKYVYDDLLTGPYGCEKDLQLERQQPTSSEADSDKRFKLRQTKRAEYPFRLWYDYNKLGINEPIPVPEILVEKYKVLPPVKRGGYPDHCYNGILDGNETNIDRGGACGDTGPQPNRMPKYEIGGGEIQYGPGFLSSVVINYTKSPKEVNATNIINYFNSPEDYLKDNSGFLDKNCPPDSRFQKNILDCLLAGDLFLDVNAWPVSVGRNQGGTLSGEGSRVNQQKDTSFEQTIGVY